MLLSITLIKLRSPFQFFALSYQGLQIVRQLQTTNCVVQKNTGFWKNHYTMTLWHSEAEMKAFVHSGAHKEAMKLSAELATELWFVTLETDKILPWAAAKELVKSKGRVMQMGGK